ncbi:MAG: hypothetical protein Q9P14_10880 [candidate division KSB1 bacterium]|nr:hypothetical protein [candidate division KSB1 bacterium]MDQ7063234.1 hypothetical protein [candidate division KSB1 bacterium]
MKRMLAVSVVFLLLVGCAGSRHHGTAGNVFLKVKNNLADAARIYWQQPYQRPVYLGKVKPGREGSFLLKGPFSARGFRLIARGSFGEALLADLPVDLDVGKRLIWELSRHTFYWTER